MQFSEEYNNVTLLPNELKTLNKKHSPITLLKMISLYSNWKLTKGDKHKSKSDYGSINGWVQREVYKSEPVRVADNSIF